LQQYDRALFSFKEFVNKSGKGQANIADGYIRLADCYYVSKEYGEALTNYRKAIQLNAPDADYAHMQAGVILGIQRNYAEAGRELEQVVKHTNSSYFEEAQFQLAQLNFEQGNYAVAADGYSRLITTNPSSRFVPYAYMRRAASYYNLKDYNKTAQDYITVIENYPNHPAGNDIILPLQEALNLAGRSAEFDGYLAQFKKAHPDAKGIESVEFETVKNLYFNQEYQKAIQSLGNYIAAYPQSPRLAEAKYYQAESYYRLKDATKALVLYYDLSTDKTFSFANKVTGRIAELEFKQGQYDKAVPFFKELARIAANKKEQYTAWSGLMESYYLLAQYDSADAYARVILEKGNVNAGAQNKASLYLGKVAMAKGDYETAKDEFLNTLNSAQDEYGAEAKYSLAEIFYFSKDYKQCNETLFSLNKDFDSYTLWVGKSYLLLADSFLAMGDSFQAKGTLKSLIDGNFPLQNIKDMAKDKLNKIDQSELKKQEQAKQDTTDNDKN
jgi:TolA-binding protein